ncbi:MAG TPA: amidohydrolase [Mycobacteriales bacterium]|nr:amidohydrolase [Mycobacteriales bacterium]
MTSGSSISAPRRLAAPWLDRWLAGHATELVAVRRRLHSRPELGYAEHETTALLVERLTAAGLAPRVLPSGTGVTCDVGSGSRVVALRADIDALPLMDVKEVPYASTVPGVCHACGHDAHTTMVLGAALALAGAPELGGRVRVIFQPAEESVPGGALDAIDGGVLKDVERIFALHCDPRLATGRVGLRTGPITAACDQVSVRLTGPGGHTARPHNTVDLVYALGKVITGVPGLLSRRADPRHGMSLVWGAVESGVAPNTIPRDGVLRGTVRMLSRDAWDSAEALVRGLIAEVAAPTGAVADVHYVQGVPPVVNDATSVGLLRAGTASALGPDAADDTEQSLGGEDFAWYLSHVPGALARLGVRSPAAAGPALDLHQPSFDIDEDALAVGVRLLVHTALTVLG